MSTIATSVAAPPRLGEVAPDIGLRSLDGQARRLSDFTGRGPLALIFLRHLA